MKTKTTEQILQEFREKYLYLLKHNPGNKAFLDELEQFIKEALDTAYLAGGYDLRRKLIYDLPKFAHGKCERLHEESIEEAYDLFYDELKANKNIVRFPKDVVNKVVNKSLPENKVVNYEKKNM